MSKSLSNTIMERSKFLIEKARALATNTEKVSSIVKDVNTDEILIKDSDNELDNNYNDTDQEIYNKEFAHFDKFNNVNDMKIISNFENTQNDSLDDINKEISNIKTSERDMNSEVDCVKSERLNIQSDKKKLRDTKKDNLKKNSDTFMLNNNF